MEEVHMKSFLGKFTVSTAAVLWMTVLAPQSSGADPSIWAPPPLYQLIQEGLENNQSIQSLEFIVQSLKEEIDFAGSLNDPRLGVGLLNLPTDTFNFDQEPMTQKQIFIAQKIPWFGKLSLQSQQAALKAIKQAAILDAKRLELARQIAVAYYELSFVSSSQEINERLIGMMNQLLRVAETKYAAGSGLQQDVLHAQVELSKLLDEKIMLEQKHRTLEDQMNGLLNRENFIPIPLPQRLPYPDLTVQTKELQTLALARNPWLKVRQAEIDKAAVETQLARKDYWPDMDFKVAYGQRDESKAGQDWADFFSASVVMNIPLWKKNRQDKKLSANQSRHQAALRSYQNLVRSLPHKIDALATDIQNIQKNYRLITDALIVQAEQWAHSSLAAYEVGKVEFNTMLTAQIRLLRFELQSVNYLLSLYKKRAELEEVLGGPMSFKDLGGTVPHLHKENTS